MAREFSEESTPQWDADVNSYRNDPKRTPTNHRGSSDIPVLFRFKNLQRNDEMEKANSSSSSATVNKSSNPNELGQSYSNKATTTRTNQSKQTTVATQNAKEESKATEEVSVSVDNSKVSPVLDQKPGRPWSTNAILLSLGIGVLFILSHRNSSEKPNVASSSKIGLELAAGSTEKVATATVSSSDNSSATQKALLVAFPEPAEEKKSDTFSLVAPLAAPKLPDPMELLTEKDRADSAGNVASTSNNASAIDANIDSDSLELPSPNSSTLNQDHRSVMIPAATSGSKIKSQLEPSISQSIPVRQTTPTIIQNPHVASAQLTNPAEPKKDSLLVSTATPDLETAELFALRNRLGSATMQSQQQAMARNRIPISSDSSQQQWGDNGTAANSLSNLNAQTPNSISTNPQSTLVSGPAQPPIVYTPPTNVSPSYQYQPIQPAPAGYGVQNPVSPSNTPASVNKPYVPISNTLIPEAYSNQGNAFNSMTQQPQWQTPESSATQSTQGMYTPSQYPSNQYSGPQPTNFASPSSSPSTGGYQPLSPQFQSQPMNGN